MSTESDGGPCATVTSFGYRQELKRSLSLLDLLIYGLVLISPTAPIPLFGIIYDASGGMVPLVYALGLGAMLFTALSYMAMSREFPLAGSVYAYARGAFGDNAGFIAGWAMILDYLLAPALIYLAAAVAIDAVLPGVPLEVWAIGLLIGNTVINLRGIDSVTRANIGLLVLQLAAVGLFFIFAVAALLKGTAGAHLSTSPFFHSSRVAPAVILGGVSIGVLSYLGFDGVSTLAEETRGGPSVVSRATLLTVLVTAVLFIGQSYLASLFVQHAFAPGKASYAAFYTVAGIIGGVWFKVMLSITGVFLANIASGLSTQAATSRLLFSMARDGQLPRVLAHVDPQRRVPNRAILLVAVVTCGLILYFASRIELLVTIVSFGAMTGFLFVHASVVRYFLWRKGSRDWLRHLVAPTLGFAVIGFVMLSMNANAKRIGLGWIAISLAVVLARRFTSTDGRVRTPR